MFVMKPEIVREIERLSGFELRLSEKNLGPLRGVMGVKYPRYALDENGRLAGLNLADVKLDNAKWKKIEGVLEKHRVRLQALDLYENNLAEFSLSPGLAHLSYLDIGGNPLESPPEEIMNQGKDAVLRFLKNLLAQGARELFEVKMLIVGEGETGKTTLWNLLQNPGHPVPDPKQKSTVGIQILEGWKFQHLDRPDDEFLVNLWDFGGQAIQYMTHQFFLTRRSFYVLLADGRREVANFPYWLQIIELLGCEDVEEKEKKALPVLVVLNEKGNPIAKMPYDPETVKKDYPGLDIIRREVDFGKKDDGRIEVLTMAIQQILCRRIDHLPLTIPAFWDNVRQRLFNLRNSDRPVNHINAERFSRICEEEGVAGKQQQADLSQLLHDLGAILHFREDINLADFIILDPQWAVNAVYEIMKHEEVKTDNQGRFDQQLLQRVWTEKGYTPEEQGKLLNLMLKNNLEVCFRATENRREIFIAPQLLPEMKPAELEWEKTPETLRYIYHYPFMPRGIIGRLIVRLNEYIESSGKKKVVWENGMIIQKDGCRAQVQFVDDKAQGRQIIKMEVQGESAEDRKNVLRDIRRELETIHRRSFPALRVFQKVPCNCAECERSVDPFEHDFDRLQANKLKHGDEARAQCGRSFENVPVQKLLEGVFKEEEMLHKAELLQGREKQTVIIKNKIVMPDQNPSADPRDASNIFSYAAALVIVAGIVLVLLNTVDFWKALLGVVAMVIFLTMLGALQLKNDKLLSEKSFMELMAMVFKKIPPLSFFSKKGK